MEKKLGAGLGVTSGKATVCGEAPVEDWGEFWEKRALLESTAQQQWFNPTKSRNRTNPKFFFIFKQNKTGRRGVDILKPNQFWTDQD
jgi:hypothetical protein